MFEPWHENTIGCCSGEFQAELPEIQSFIPWCVEQAPAYLGFIPATKKQRQKEGVMETDEPRKKLSYFSLYWLLNKIGILG